VTLLLGAVGFYGGVAFIVSGCAVAESVFWGMEQGNVASIVISPSTSLCRARCSMLVDALLRFYM
jgi:hypothetical protein